MSVLVTGATGFIGHHLVQALGKETCPVSLQDFRWPQGSAGEKYSKLVHLAGLAHGAKSEEEIWELNVQATKTLAKEALQKGVKRFVFISSIQAVSEKNAGDGPENTKTSASAQGPYGRSKLEAEQLLRGLSMKGRMEVVIIRPPLVYGPLVKANFRNLFQLVDKGIPMPLTALESNRRSFAGISNLIDLILLCLENPAAANQTFHVSDDDDISTAELLRRMGKALGKPVRNLPIPKTVLKTGLRMIGKGEWVEKLFGDLRVDISETKRLLGWRPKTTMEEELARTAHWWKTRKE